MPYMSLQKDLYEPFEEFLSRIYGQSPAKGVGTDEEVARWFVRGRLLVVRQESDEFYEVFCADSDILKKVEENWNKVLEESMEENKDAEA